MEIAPNTKSMPPPSVVLTDQQVRELSQNGYLALSAITTSGEVARLHVRELDSRRASSTTCSAMTTKEDLPCCHKFSSLGTLPQNSITRNSDPMPLLLQNSCLATMRGPNPVAPGRSSW